MLMRDSGTIYTSHTKSGVQEQEANNRTG